MLKSVHGGDPTTTYGVDDFSNFQARLRSSGLVKSHPLVKSRECPGVSPNLPASLFTRSGEYNSVRSAPKMTDDTIRLSSSDRVANKESISTLPSADP